MKKLTPCDKMQNAYLDMLKAYGPNFTWGFIEGLKSKCEELMLKEARNE